MNILLSELISVDRFSFVTVMTHEASGQWPSPGQPQVSRAIALIFSRGKGSVSCTAVASLLLGQTPLGVNYPIWYRLQVVMRYSGEILYLEFISHAENAFEPHFAFWLHFTYQIGLKWGMKYLRNWLQFEMRPKCGLGMTDESEAGW